MDIVGKEVGLQITVPYYTWGTPSHQTKNFWVVCHGYGQLAQYFIRRFDILDPLSHYVVAPQGLSRFYLDNSYQKVGASWMTRIDRSQEILRQQVYLNQVLEKEFSNHPFDHVKVNLLGFSQGVATITRWAALQQINFDLMVLWAGSFPKDISHDAFDYLKPQAEIWAVVGNQDPYLNALQLEIEEKRLRDVFKDQLKTKLFEGKHEMNRVILQELLVSTNMK